jgi:hypothetical protein
MIGKRTLTMLVLLTIALVAPGARAQVDVVASVSADRVYVGDGVRLQVQVAGTKNPERPRIPAVPGAVIEFEGGQDASRHSIVIINGRRTEESFDGFVFSFKVVPTAAGRFTVPPITVVVDGQEYKTNPVSFTAIEPGDADGFKLTVEAEKTSVYAGEPVRLRITWYLLEDANGGTFSMPPANGAFDLLPAPTPAGANGHDFTLFGQPATAILGRGELDGERCKTITVDRILIARRPGNVTLGPLRLAFDQVVGSGFFGRTTRKVITSNPLTFEVKALPQPQPPGFTGLVGKYEVGAQASATDVNVGDPITLTVVVRGPEPLESVPAMNLVDQPGFTGSFKISDEPMLPSIVDAGDGRAVVLTGTIRAERDTVSEIPPVELPYFDISTGKYGVARSSPIRLNVKPTTEVRLPSDPERANEPVTHAEQTVGGLAPAVRSLDALTQGAFDVAAALRSPLVIGLLGGPALLYLASAGVVTLRRRAERDPARRRRRGAARRAVRRLGRAGDDTARIESALRGFVADWFDLPEAGLTTAECAARVHDTGVPSAPAFDELLRACDATLYAGAGNHKDASPTAAADVVRRLSRDLEARA